MIGSIKTAIVTGASRGIGRAITDDLLNQGWQVIGIARNFRDNPIDHPNFTPKEIDLGRIDQLPNILKHLSQHHQSIDAIISNAGRGHFGHLEEFSYEQVRELMDINLLSHIYLTKAFIANMKKQGAGDIIFVGSEAALSGKRKGTIYCASKFALRGFAQALRDECATSDIRISIINPGMVNTTFFDSQSFRPGEEPSEHIAPKDVAEAVSMILNTRKGTVFDEINLSPQKNKIVWSKS